MDIEIITAALVSAGIPAIINKGNIKVQSYDPNNDFWNTFRISGSKIKVCSLVFDMADPNWSIYVDSMLKARVHCVEQRTCSNCPLGPCPWR